MRAHTAGALLLLTLSAACAGRSNIAPNPGVAPTWSYRGKALVVDAPKAMVVSGSPIASAVGRDILRLGGNAVDAAVAVGFALAVVHPEAGNIGGGGFMLVLPSGGQPQALDYRETAPARANRDMYRNAAEDASVTGHLSVAVPCG